MAVGVVVVSLAGGGGGGGRGANSRPFLAKQQRSRWDFGAPTTCCEERPVPSPAPGALLARLTVPA